MYACIQNGYHLVPQNDKQNENVHKNLQKSTKYKISLNKNSTQQKKERKKIRFLFAPFLNIKCTNACDSPTTHKHIKPV